MKRGGATHNNPVELTAYSVRSFVAPASGSSSPGALDACGVEEKTKPLFSDWALSQLSRKKEHGKKTKAMDI
jgi:hypothetical protein